MLEIENLTVEVAGKEILHNVSLSVKSGYTTVLFGPNGSGKSTLLMTIMGFSGYKVRSGRILLNGEDITHLPVNERAKRGIGMMMQRPPNITGVRLKDLVRIAGKGKVDIAKIAEELDMTNFLERDVNVGFSGGEIKRSEILQLTAQNPCLLLLDEPESGVDMVSIEKLGAKVRELLQGPSHCAGWRRGAARPRSSSPTQARYWTTWRRTAATSCATAPWPAPATPASSWRRSARWGIRSASAASSTSLIWS